MIKTLSNNTIVLYNRLLKQLKKYNINYDNIDNINDYITKIHNIVLDNGNPIKSSHVRMYLTATQWYLKNNGGNINYQEEIKKEIIKLNTLYNNNIQSNILCGTQQTNYIEWSKIMDVYYDTMEDKHESFTKYKTFVILSCYVLLPPRRLIDYSDMFILDTCDTINYNDLKHNYYCMKEKLFIFNNYKTSYKYGTQLVRVPDNLSVILDNYITYWLLPCYGSLFNMTSSCIQHCLTNLFKKKLNKNISVNILRHSYISHIKNNGDIAGNERTISKLMSHSLEMQTDYYKNPDKKNYIINDNNIISML